MVPELKLIKMFLGLMNLHVATESAEGLTVQTSPPGIQFNIGGDNTGILIIIGETTQPYFGLTVDAIQNALRIAECLQIITDTIAAIKRGEHRDFAIHSLTTPWNVIATNPPNVVGNIADLMEEGLKHRVFQTKP